MRSVASKLKLYDDVVVVTFLCTPDDVVMCGLLVRGYAKRSVQMRGMFYVLSVNGLQYQILVYDDVAVVTFLWAPDDIK
ncbi:hypothetical protein Tco_0877654 [Tanacetum coccineum]|uniref:Uncharacterized protein n=1 Tax=Tanacetum coccineum TaxID=301880 RepID=A0ABQ5BZ48_9ASTR